VEKSELKKQLAEATAVLNWCIKSEDARRINAMLEMAKSEPGIAITTDELDRDPWLFNCPNGTLELKTGRLREHRREDYITKLCPVAYDPCAQAPMFQRFLQDIFDDNSALILYLQRLVGRCLTGDVSEQDLHIFWGSGANGKSTLLNVIMEVMGPDYTMMAPAQLLMSKRNAHPTEKADLFGMRLVACMESDADQRMSEALVKTLTGGDRIRARRMHEDFWEFSPTHKLILCTNHKPQIRGTDHAIWRRIRLVPFTVTFTEERQDKQLPEKLRAELPGILAWAVEGCLEWQRHGMMPPEAVLEATKEYRVEEDLLAQWLEECCLTGSPNYRQRAGQLYASYHAWCERGGETPQRQKSFGDAMTERGFTRERSSGLWYVGVALRDASENEDDQV
jgi:putative DNA primase/helicase